MATLFLVGTLHAIVILGVTFGAPGSLRDEARSLEVVLVQQPADEAGSNPNAAYLAQVTQHGAGSAPDARTSDTPHTESSETEGPAAHDDATGHGSAQGDGDARDSLLETRAPTTAPLTYALGSDGILSTAPLVMQPLEAAAELSRPGSGLSLRGPVSRELLVTPDTRNSSAAVYLDAWRHRIESVGTLNYPMQATRQRNAASNPVLEVQILADGSLGSAVLRRSSGYPELDRAALAILRLAAPFPPFPPALAQRNDALRLTYEWQFQDGSSVVSSVRVPAAAP